MFLGIGYGDRQVKFIARDSNKDNVKALVLLNRPKCYITEDENTIEKIMENIPFEVDESGVTFTFYEDLPTLEIHHVERFVVNPLVQENNLLMVQGLLMNKNGSVINFNDTITVSIIKPSGKKMDVEIEFENGATMVGFPPDEGGEWIMATKGCYDTYKIVETKRVNVVYKLPMIK